jgi:WD40 repeat protein
MADVFISYSRKDETFVRRLHGSLRERGRNTWVDWEDIPPSAKWRQEIYSAIEATDTIIFVISRHSVASKVCMDEIAHAILHNKRLIPVVWEAAPEADLPTAVQDRNWIFARESDDFDVAFESVMKAIDTDLDWVRAHTRLLTRAIEWNDNKRDYSFALHGSDLQRAELHLTIGEGKEPRLTPIQIEYILTSRRDANKRRTRLLGVGALALTAIVVFGLLFWQKRQESNLTLAGSFREKGISELANQNPLTAEVLLARALILNDGPETRQLLLQARAKSPQLLWVNPQHDNRSVIAMSPDGALFALKTGTDVEVWSVKNRDKTRLFETKQSVKAVALSSDDRVIAVASDNDIKLWNVELGSDQPTRVIENEPEVLTLSFSPDGKLLISGHSGGLISIWNLGKQEPPVRLRQHANDIKGTMVSVDGLFLVSGSLDNRVKLWDLATGKELATLAGHDDAVLSVAFSPDGELVASGGWDNRIWLWDRATGKKLRFLEGHKGGILSLAFSPDGKWLVSGSEDRTARLWEAETGRHVLTLPGHQSYVNSVTFVGSEGHHLIATGDVTGIVRLWDIDSIGQRDELITLRGHEGPVSVLSFSRNAPLVASGSWDKTVRFWDLRTRKVVGQLTAHRDAITALKFSPDGKLLATGSKDSTVRLWNMARMPENESEATRTLSHAKGGDNMVRDLAFSLNGEVLATASDDKKIRILNVKDGSLLNVFDAHKLKTQGLAFSPDGHLLASASDDKTIKLWRVGDWTLVNTLNGHESGVWQLAFSPDGRFLLSASDDRTARLWDVESGREVVAPLEHDGSVWSVDFSPDGKAIATGCADSTVHLWDIDTSGGRVKLGNRTVLRISDGPIWFVKFNRDADDVQLGIGSIDKTMRIFSIRRFRTLFADPARLQSDAERKSGLQVRPDKSAPDVVPIPTHADRAASTSRPLSGSYDPEPMN